MAKFDIESFRDNFIDLLQSNMAAKVSEINTEKGDSLIADIPAAQYTSNYNETVLNFDVVMYHKIARIETLDSHAGGIAREITMVFAVVFCNQDDWGIAESKILRYTRAIEEIFLENARRQPCISDLTIEAFEPDMVQLSENSPLFQAGGVQLKGVITT